MVIVYCLLILILLCIVYSFVPYVGIVTILMNDYPKFKVSAIYHSVLQTIFPNSNSDRLLLVLGSSVIMLNLFFIF